MLGKLKLQCDGYYVLRNEITRETALLKVSEISECKGQVLVAGHTSKHEIYYPSFGRRLVDPRPAAFPVFPRESIADVQEFMVVIESLPLNLYDEAMSARVPVPAPQFPHHGPLDQETVTGWAARLIDGWYYWRLTGVLPDSLARDVQGGAVPLSVRSTN